MIVILLIFVTGIVVGWVLRRLKALMKLSSKLTFLSVLALLFLLGYEAGKNQEVQAHFDEIGIVSLVISFLSVAGSIVFIMFFNHFVLKK